MQKAMQADAAVFRYAYTRIYRLLDRLADSAPFSTQQSLDEGVKKIREIFKTYDSVGIKDRSMIWNS